MDISGKKFGSLLVFSILFLWNEPAFAQLENLDERQREEIHAFLANPPTNRLVIRDGETHTIDAGTKLISYGELVIGNNATLDIANNTETLLIFGRTTAKSSSLINGRGGKGQNGSNATIYLGDADLQGLVIDVSGGKGIQGAKGDRGKEGEDTGCFWADHATDGQEGYPGRSGGRGGNGGKIELYFEGSRGPFGLEAIAKGGEGGNGGEGGDGGIGGEGASCLFYHRGHGHNGAKGPRGPNGSNGKDGKAILNLISK